MKNKTYNPGKLSSFIFYISILIFIIAFNFSDNPPVSGWKQQFMPYLNNQYVSDITFIDSLLGFAVTYNDTPGDTGYVLKTTNSGNNWYIVFQNRADFNRVIFLNESTGFVCGGSGSGTEYLYKSTNAGKNWFLISTPNVITWNDMFIENEDTIWLANESGFDGGLFRTSNGGINWELKFFSTLYNPLKIYMYNSRIGYICESDYLFKTTNSGDNWILQPGKQAFRDIYFADSLLGWKSNSADLINDTLVKTTNGGLNWFNIDVPRSGAIYGGNISRFNGMRYFSHINKDTIWGSGGAISYPGNVYRAILFKSNNGGLNWLIQIPDTAFRFSGFFFNIFLNKNHGWAYQTNYKGIYTTTGGDSTFFTSIDEAVFSQPDNFILKQNYPNPFNPVTTIEYEISSKGFINLSVYNIQGKKQTELVNKIQNTGNYKVNLNGSNLPSGVYFYTMFVNGNRIQTKKMMLVK